MARQVFHEGWSAVVAPKASFSLPGYEAKPFTVIRQEFPFHGLFGWPLVKLFGHEFAMMRLISVAFALASIEWMFLILQVWLAPRHAAAGAALWAWSPLLLQFGQVPMPDILCTAGMLAAFWFALKQNLPASSGWFLFAILAKVSVIVFGLPVLTALILARNCRSVGECFRVAVFWGAVPLAGLICWTSLELRHPDTPWTVLNIISGRSSLNNLLTLKLYLFLLACLLPYGLGLLGGLGCVLAATGKQVSKIKPGIKWSLAVSNLFYLVFVLAKIPEPQYLLPPLAWLVVAAAFGLERLTDGPLRHVRARLALAALLGVQALTVFAFTYDLKAARVPDFQAVENAARLIPAHSRVIVAYPFYGASPAVWLNQNDFAVNDAAALAAGLPKLQKAGFDYVLILDVKSHTEGFWQGGLAKTGAGWLHMDPRAAAGDATLTGFANPASSFRRFCDGRFAPIFSSRHVVLYSLKPPERPPP